jgi:hypothetical protein
MVLIYYQVGRKVRRRLRRSAAPPVSRRTSGRGCDAVLDQVHLDTDALGVDLERFAELMLWITVFDCFVVGAALDLTAPDDVWRSENDKLPVLDEALRAAPRGRRRADEAFEIGLDALLTGLRQRLVAAR